ALTCSRRAMRRRCSAAVASSSWSSSASSTGIRARSAMGRLLPGGSELVGSDVRGSVAVDELEGAELAEGVVEPAAAGGVLGALGDLLVAQRRRPDLDENAEDRPLGLAEGAEPVV